MKNLNNRWYDENGNSWDQEKYSEEEACAASRSMIDCHNCYDCHDCHYSYNCHHSRRCHRCHNCHHCHGCRRCHNCHHFKQDPRKFTSGNIGSRAAKTTFFWTEDRNQIVCGCYRGSLDEFEARVEEVHRDSQYGDEYKQFIKQCRSLLTK